MEHKTYDWAVVGAGPAGIAAVGKLIDAGVTPQQILWIDPAFTVGDFGTKWRHVSSNTRVDLFLKFFNACLSFRQPSCPTTFAIENLDPQQTCLLSLAAEPLQWISDHLKNTVHAVYDTVQRLQLDEDHWQLSLSDNSQACAQRVILAQGSEPKSLALPNIEEIPLNIALNPEQLAASCQPDDVVAVFGSSHSAILILKTLVERCQVKKVINFYQSPLRYAVYLKDEILFDNSGLKGMAAQWAKTHLDGTWPASLERVLSQSDTMASHLTTCHKTIYATGFQQRVMPIEGIATLAYDASNGVIAPGLFGVGIAFPEAKRNHLGEVEYQVGLWKFMTHLNQVLPSWLADTKLAA